MGRHRRDPTAGGRCRRPSRAHSRPHGRATIPRRVIRSQAALCGCRYDFGVGLESLGGPQPRSLTGPVARRLSDRGYASVKAL